MSAEDKGEANYEPSQGGDIPDLSLQANILASYYDLLHKNYPPNSGWNHEPNSHNILQSKYALSNCPQKVEIATLVQVLGTAIQSQEFQASSAAIAELWNKNCDASVYFKFEYDKLQWLGTISGSGCARSWRFITLHLPTNNFLFASPVESLESPNDQLKSAEGFLHKLFPESEKSSSMR